MITEDQIKQLKARFDQLLKAQIAPRISADDNAPTMFDPKGNDVRKRFAVNTLWEKFIKEALAEFELEGRTINLLLQPDKSNPLTIIIQPITGTIHGEQVTLFLGETPLTAENISRILHAYLTNPAARKECISNNPNYLILPKDLDTDDFLMNSSISFIPKVLLEDFDKES